MMEHLEKIDKQAALEKAREYVLEEQYREKPLAFAFVKAVVMGTISTALFNAGHSSEALNYQQREAIATEALIQAGYPQEKTNE